VSSSSLLGVGLAAFALCLVRFKPGVRVRIVGLLFVVLCVVWALGGDYSGAELPGGTNIALPIFVVLLGPTSVLSLWWWDIVVELNRARAAESRLAAVQERLRLAGDLHDLQGHHLQVIALQLELAERMLPRDPAGAAEQVRLARASVDDARRGTRELASRFRGVPLPDELANAADLLRAAGLDVALEIAPDAADAPVDVLGPVIRECTTNVLKHGGGKWARLSLRHTDGSWILRVANDAGTGTSTLGEGAGLAGIAERVQAVGGDLHSGADGDEFDVTVTVPAALAGARDEGTR
jgi:two-component system sensor histidine kinase DesK